jgi:cysteinyl-tRNA synthetase
MYVCGLTPQDSAHLGHGLMAIRFDIVRRYLTYRNLNVNFVQNVTDVEDKIIEKSARTGEDPMVMTRRYTDEFYSVLSQLNVLPVPRLAKVTDYIPQIISFVQGLVEKGFAYVTSEGSVYFKVKKKADYGKLSNQNVEALYESVRKELDKEKDSPLDFALWKRDEGNSLCRPSPWGMGRPGWHIECSVMIFETLGSTIDIHGGGLDLKFPHHENEVAQTEAYTGKSFANVWMHSGLLNIDGQKMSKSLNNFIRLTDGAERYGNSLLRFVITRHHYRSGIDLTDKLFRDNINSLLEFHRLFDKFAPLPEFTSELFTNTEVSELVSAFERAMDNDFNTPEALVALEQVRANVTQELDAGKGAADDKAALVTVLKELGRVMGLFFESTEAVESAGLKLLGSMAGQEPLTRETVAQLIQKRAEARKTKDFARADEIRKACLARGVEILDGKAGTTWRFSTV